MSSERKLARSAAVVGSGIMTSRVLGFVRDVLVAKFFGTEIFAQAFVVAFMVPNVLRQLVAEGAVNTALVPIFAEYRLKKYKSEFLRFANVILNQLFLILFFITLIGILISPILIRIIAPGFISDPDKFSITVYLTRILFPYIMLVGLSAYCMGVLHAFNHFVTPAFATAVWNGTIIACMLIFYRSFDVTYLALAVLAGGLLQLMIQLYPLFKIGPFFDVKAGLFHKDTKRVGRLLLPRIMGAGIYQINIIVDKMLASLHLIVGEGAVAALYYANRLFQLPLALFSIAIATAALPAMSLLVAEKNINKLKEAITFSMRNMLLLSIPAAVGLMVLSKPIIKVIFERGEFTSYDTGITSSALFFYAIGLVAYGGVNILVAAFHAMQDTRTPVKIASLALFLNLILNIILMVPLKVGGLALATSISGFVNFLCLLVTIRKRLGGFAKIEIVRFLLKVTAASVIMGIVAYAVMRNISWDSGAKGFMGLAITVLLSVVVFLSASAALKVKEMRILFAWIKRY